MTGRPKGFPKTGGRKCGTPNKRTLALEQAAAEAAGKIASALGDTAFEGDAHSLLMAVYKDTSKPLELRIQAAKAAIGFEKPRLAAVAASVEGQMSLEELVLGACKPRNP
jgi:hypothetical protein